MLNPGRLTLWDTRPIHDGAEKPVLSAPYQTQQHEKHQGSDGRGNDAAQQAAGKESQVAQKESAEHRAEHADDEIANEAEATAFDDLSREPARR